MLHFGVVSVMPEMFTSIHSGVTGRAIAEGFEDFQHWNPRDWARTNHGQVDDKPYGGGPGMVMMFEPWHSAIDYARSYLPSSCKTIYLSPQGRTIRQDDLNEMVRLKQSLLFIAGRYEGLDERIIDQDVFRRPARA